MLLLDSVFMDMNWNYAKTAPVQIRTIFPDVTGRVNMEGSSCYVTIAVLCMHGKHHAFLILQRMRKIERLQHFAVPQHYI